MNAVRSPRPLRAALSVFRIEFIKGLQYRVAALSGAAISIFWALIEITVYIVFFTHADRASVPGISGGMTLAQAVSYSWLGQVLWALAPMSVGNDILVQIEKGDISVELLRPFHLYNHWFARSAAQRLTPLVFRGSAVLLAGLLAPAAYRLGAPASPAALLCTLASVGCAAVLGTSFANFMAAVRMNVEWGNGPMFIIMLLSGVLSGGYLPLKLWPDALQTFLLYQPFAGYLDIPMRLYLGLLPAGEAWLYWLMQLGWAAGFVLAGRLLMGHRLRNIVVQGG